MKNTPDSLKLRNRLQSSKFSGSGFMGDDGRSVEEIISEDLHIMQKHGVSKEKLVHNLKMYYQIIQEALGTKFIFNDNIYGEFYEAMGRIPSPFIGDGTFAKGEAVIVNEKSSEKFVITALAINLIENHDFFQGKHSRYRLDPLELKQLFDKLEDTKG